jgi:hypothetical protein
MQLVHEPLKVVTRFSIVTNLVDEFLTDCDLLTVLFNRSSFAILQIETLLLDLTLTSSELIELTRELGSL